MYPFAYVVVIIGIAIYHIFPAPTPVMGTFDESKFEKERRELMGLPVDDLEQNQGTADVDERASSEKHSVDEKSPKTADAS